MEVVPPQEYHIFEETPPVFYTSDEVPIPARPTAEAPLFNIQQNTQLQEIDALREEYPREIFMQNYQMLAHQVLRSWSQEVHEAIVRVRRIQAAMYAFRTAPQKLKRPIRRMIENTLPTREGLYALNERTEIKDSRPYQDALCTIEEYFSVRRTFFQNRITYGPKQAEFNRRVAMIRQKPAIPVTINTQEIIETVNQWEHVWGVAIKHTERDNYLYIRIGLCDIVMDDSAPETEYDYAASIKLAPFYFTIRLDTQGRFMCPSTDAHVLGLSFQESGMYWYDIHPHQLSDTPCFGSFGQTFNDLAANGDMISLVSGIIAFYSQYNSQDSAGVNALRYHPSNEHGFDKPNDIGAYVNYMNDGINGYSNYHTIDQNKLEQAMERYIEWFDWARENEAAPIIECTHYCSSCEENPVSDNHEFAIDNWDQRICMTCWDNSYCQACERHEDDCRCDPDERY
jgi:hypothetical protein